jgi:hypothetical protein
VLLVVLPVAEKESAREVGALLRRRGRRGKVVGAAWLFGRFVGRFGY